MKAVSIIFTLGDLYFSNSRCPCGEFCSNRKFQVGQKVHVEAFKTDKKGWGLRTLEDISACVLLHLYRLELLALIAHVHCWSYLHRHQFVMEYSGEVMGYDEFEKRVEMYDRENRRHYYFMTLRADEVSLC